MPVCQLLRRDWSILFQLPLHIVNFDAYGFLDSMLAYGEELEGFLRRGGCLGWGLVPTSEPVAQEDAFSLRENFMRVSGAFPGRGLAQIFWPVSIY